MRTEVDRRKAYESEEDVQLNAIMLGQAYVTEGD